MTTDPAPQLPPAGLRAYRSYQSAGRRPGETLDGVGELPEVEDQADVVDVDEDLGAVWSSYGRVVEVDVAGGRL